MPARKTDELIDDAATVDPELLADAPALKPVGAMRWRERQPVLNALQDLQGKVSKGQLKVTGAGDVAGLVGMLDETLERYAVDPDAYAKWATGASAQQILALFMRFGGEVAKLIGSTT